MILRAMTWDDEKGRGVARAMTWEGTKRRRVLATALASLAALLILQPPAPAGGRAPFRGSRAPVTVIVTAAPGELAAARRAVVLAGGTVESELSVIDGLVAAVPADTLASLQHAPGVRAVSPNERLRPMSDDSVDQDEDETTGTPRSMLLSARVLGADRLWDAGITGQGVDVALVDTGVATVPGLDGQGKVLNGPDLSFDAPNPQRRYRDGHGHGTHIAGIIAGHDPVSADSSDHLGFQGISRDARIVNVRVGARDGAVDVTQVIAGIGWVIAHRADPGLNVRVLNLSYGTHSRQPYVVDPLAMAAEAAWRAGIVVVTAAGNGGGALVDPAYDPYVIAVGAEDMNGTIDVGQHVVAPFSNAGDGVRSPDVVAPGAHIASLRVPMSAIDAAFGPVASDERFQLGSGTSQAAAMVSGAAALLLQQHPGWTPDQVKYALKSTAVRLPLAGPLSQGSGLVNVAAAAAVAAELAPVQRFAASLGLGSIEAARGTAHVALNGILLVGEKDIFGQFTSGAALLTGGTWSAGTWSGGTWTAGTWSAGTWSAGTWSGATWSGGTWTAGTWSAGTWSAGTWSAATWSGDLWE